MGETFKAFIAFISEDPIMLGLCIAIIVLIIMFILVLVLGKKKDKKEEALSNTSDELLKTEINMEALKSTSEYKLDELNNVIKPDIEATKIEPKEEEPIVEEIPVTTEEPIKVEIEDKPEEIIDTPIETSIEEPLNEPVTSPMSTAYPTFDNIQITDNRETENSNESSIVEEDLNNISVIESNEIPIEENTETPYSMENPKIEEENLQDLNIVESTINPIEEAPIVKEETENSVFPILTEENLIKDEASIELPKPESDPTEEITPVDIPNITLEDNILSVTPTIEEQIPPVKEFTEEPIIASVPEEKPDAEELPIASTAQEPTIETSSIEENKEQIEEEENVELPDYSDIYTIDDIELPNINFDEFDSSPKEIKNETTSEDDDDLDLPKLNVNSSSTINSVQGESFKIN